MQIVRKKLSASEITPPNVRYDAECDCVQSTYDGGATWVDNPGADPRISPAFRAPANATADPQCNAAAGMVALLRSLIDADLAATTALGLTSTWFGILFLVFPIGIIADILLLIADVILGIGSAAIAASFTEEVYDGLLCVFYNNIDADGQMSDAQLADIYTAIAAEFDLTVQAVFGAHSSGIGPVGWSNAGALGSETGDCAVCGEWCKVFDFTSDDGGFALIADVGGGYSGGWATGYFDAGTGYYQNVGAALSGFDSTTFTYAKISYDYAAGNLSSLGGNSTLAVGIGAGFPINIIGMTPDAGYTEWMGSVSGDNLSVYLCVGLWTDGDPGGSGLITRLELHGTGDNPFGMDNC